MFAKHQPRLLYFFQDYDHHFCKCRCSNSEAKAACSQEKGRKFWDERNCQCVCRAEEYRECSTGFVYDAIDTCKCVRTKSKFHWINRYQNDTAVSSASSTRTKWGFVRK